MQQIKGTGKRDLIIPDQNIVYRNKSAWTSPTTIWQQRSTQYGREPFICGGWFKPSPDDNTYCVIGQEDYDQGSASGYSAYRVYTQVSGIGYTQVNFDSYRSGGQQTLTATLENPDRDQWFFFMMEYQSPEQVGCYINGTYLGSIVYGSQDGPYPTAQNRSN